MEILGLQSGSMLFAHQKGFGLIGPDAKVAPLQGFGGLDLNSGGGHELRVSADGGAVQVDSWQPRHVYRFALAERRVAFHGGSRLFVLCRQRGASLRCQAPAAEIGAPFTAGVVEPSQFVTSSPGACVTGANSSASAGGSTSTRRSPSAKR